MNEAALVGLYSYKPLWSIIATSIIFFGRGWYCVFTCLLSTCPFQGYFSFQHYFLMTNGCLGKSSLSLSLSLHSFLSRACRLWKDTACSFVHTLSLPGEKSSSVPSFTFNASPFIFCNSLRVESAFLIKLFASCICTIHSLWGHFYYSRRAVICNKSQE